MEKPEPYLRKGEVVFNCTIDIDEIEGFLVLPYLISDKDFDTYWQKVVETELNEAEEPTEAPISVMYDNRKHIVRDVQVEGLFKKVITTQKLRAGQIPQRLKLIITMVTTKLLNEAQSLPESLGRSTITTTNLSPDFLEETTEEE